MLNIKKNMFGNHSDKEITEFLNSKEYKWYIDGAKEGFWNGVGIGSFLGSLIGMLMMCLFGMVK